MQINPFFAYAAVGLLVLAACAQPEPAPIMAQPVYDKYGNAVGGECRAADHQPNGTFVDTLPVCEPACRPGTQPSASTAAVNQLRCIPIRRGGQGDGGNQRDPQQRG